MPPPSSGQAIKGANKDDGRRTLLLTPTYLPTKIHGLHRPSNRIQPHNSVWRAGTGDFLYQGKMRIASNSHAALFSRENKCGTGIGSRVRSKRILRWRLLIVNVLLFHNLPCTPRITKAFTTPLNIIYSELTAGCLMCHQPSCHNRFYLAMTIVPRRIP